MSHIYYYHHIALPRETGERAPAQSVFNFCTHIRPQIVPYALTDVSHTFPSQTPTAVLLH